MSDVIVRRAESVTGDPGVGEGVGLAVVGHGTERNENSAKAIEYHAERIATRGRFEEVRALFMDEDPEVDDAAGTDHGALADAGVIEDDRAHPDRRGGPLEGAEHLTGCRRG